MRTIKKSRPHPGPPGFALVMESDLDLRAVIRAALLLDGHRVECVPDCAGVLASIANPLPRSQVAFSTRAHRWARRNSLDTRHAGAA